jgi:hypothetical protein
MEVQVYYNGKWEVRGIHLNRGVGVMRDWKIKLQDLKSSHTLGDRGKYMSKGREEETTGLRVWGVSVRTWRQILFIMLIKGDPGRIHGDTNISLVYYESIKWDLKTRPIYECRYDERLKTKDEESTRLPHTGLLGELEHLQIKTRFNRRKISEIPVWNPVVKLLVCYESRNRDLCMSVGAMED